MIIVSSNDDNINILFVRTHSSPIVITFVIELKILTSSFWSIKRSFVLVEDF